MPSNSYVVIKKKKVGGERKRTTEMCTNEKLTYLLKSFETNNFFPADNINL